jgi:hypothetical protein
MTQPLRVNRTQGVCPADVDVSIASAGRQVYYPGMQQWSGAICSYDPPPVVLATKARLRSGHARRGPGDVYFSLRKVTERGTDLRGEGIRERRMDKVRGSTILVAAVLSFCLYRTGRSLNLNFCSFFLVSHEAAGPSMDGKRVRDHRSVHAARG